MHLKPKESKTITFHLKQSELAVWGASQEWRVEPGEYTVTVGGDSASGLSGKFVLNAHGANGSQPRSHGVTALPPLVIRHLLAIALIFDAVLGDGFEPAAHVHFLADVFDVGPHGFGADV